MGQLETEVVIAVAAVVAVIFGAFIGWLLRGRYAGRNMEDLDGDWQKRYHKLQRQVENLTADNSSLKASLVAEQHVLQQHKHAAAKSRTELESLREKLNTQSKNLFTLGAERDELSSQLTNNKNAVIAANQRVRELESEFAKARDFYKAQIESGVEQRKTLERKMEDARSEQESLNNLLASARTEHESVSNLLATAQSRLENLDTLEQKVISLEADNAQLRHEMTLAQKETESLRRDLADMNALKEQNRELVHCLESMESSRKQYEEDARRYRSQYDKSEQESETLRIKLGDIEKNIAEMQNKNEEARAAMAKRARATNGQKAPEGEVDDLTEIHGIGKVLEKKLHRLGIYHFRQIAAFGPAELARVNSELKDFKGRIEHDDWIGQAKELHFKKYGSCSQ